MGKALRWGLLSAVISLALLGIPDLAVAASSPRPHPVGSRVIHPPGAQIRLNTLGPARAPTAARAALKDARAGVAPDSRVFGSVRRTTGEPTQQESYNWSGYADDNSKGNTYSSVSGAWSEPTITCTSEARLANFMVGIDGNANSALEMAGTVAQCFEGRAFYYTVWYMPSTSGIHAVGDTVAPGDKIAASVSRNGTAYTLKVTDSTHTADSFSETETCAVATCPDSSAEWIAEPLTGARGDYPLPDFKTWALASASVKSGSKSGTIRVFPDDEITMMDSTITYPLAKPGPLSAAGNSFSVAWKNSY